MQSAASMYDAVLSALQSQVGAGVIALSIVGSVLAACRKLPGHLLRAVQRQCVVSVDIIGGDPLYRMLTEWLDAQPYSRKTRLLTASAQPASDSNGQRTSVLLTPAPGHHLLWHRGRPVWLSRERKEMDGGTMPGSDWTGYRETITLRMLGRSQTVARAILEEAAHVASRAGRRTRVYFFRWGEWVPLRETPPRALESVVLPAGVMERMVKTASDFLAQRDWYEDRGLSWRIAYLLEGDPGTGKTSTVRALAGHLGIDLYVVPITDHGMTDGQLANMLSRIPERSIVTMEDIDCAVDGRRVTGEAGGVSFAGLLNALDGAASRDGIITVLTTNHAERLDPALIRPGRVDHRVTFGPATSEQSARLFARFFERPVDATAVAFGAATAGRTTADIQGLLMDHRDSPHRALAAARPPRTARLAGAA
jgi:chaperone BCS1